MGWDTAKTQNNSNLIDSRKSKVPMIYWPNETPWNPKGAGTAAPASHPALGSKDKAGRYRKEAGLFDSLRPPLESGTKNPRTERTGFQTRSRTSAEIKRAPEAVIGKGSLKRRPKERLFHGALDTASDRPGNRETLRSFLPPGTRMESSPFHGLELSEAGKTGPGERRGKGKAVETPYLAAYKKSLGSLKSLSFSSTKAVSRLSLASERPGVFAARLRSLKSPVTGRRSLRSRRSVSPPAENTLDSTFVFTSPRISGAVKPWDFSAIFSSTLNGDSFSSGIEAPSTSRGRSNVSLRTTSESEPFTSPRTPRNLILPNSSGPTSSARRLTVFPETPPTLKGALRNRLADWEALRDFSGLVSEPLNFHGNRDNITFARVNKMSFIGGHHDQTGHDNNESKRAKTLAHYP